MTFSKEIMDRESSYIGFRFFSCFLDRCQNVAFLTKPNAAAAQHPHGGVYPPTQQQHKGGVTPPSNAAATAHLTLRGVDPNSNAAIGRGG